MSFSGMAILASTIYPIVSYEWESGRKYPTLLTPLVDKEKGSLTAIAKDYTKASSWFDKASGKSGFVLPNVNYYTLAIPRLRITSATVKIGGEDLSKSLVQWEGTAPPGKVGNAVVFGHSILPQYFNPDNYLSIFSTLPKLEKGDVIFANYDGITYKYTVEEMFEVRPTAVDILEQNTSDAFLTLVTCVPPGDPRKPNRLIVRARLAPTTADANIRN